MARTAFLSIIIIKWVFLPSTSMSLSLILKSNVRATDVQFLSKNRRYLWHFFSFSLSQIIHRLKKRKNDQRCRTNAKNWTFTTMKKVDGSQAWEITSPDHVSYFKCWKLFRFINDRSTSKDFHFGSNLQKRCQFTLLSNIHLKRRCSGEWFGTLFFWEIWAKV
jgi:hypothetical protein